MSKAYRFPKAQLHGDIHSVFEDVYIVTGTVTLRAPHSVFGPLRMRFSRNMTIVRQGEDLTLINSVRLNEAGLAQLDALGKVKHVIRLAGFHGMDDPFYKDRYAATVLSVDAPYVKGFLSDNPDDHYFMADGLLTEDAQLPLSDAKYFEFASCQPTEGLLLLQRDGGILLCGDAYQNWAKADKYFNFTAKIMMKKMGFIQPYNIGPGWLQYAKPDLSEVEAKLNLDFEHLIPSHGAVVKEAASQKYQAAIKALLRDKP